MKFGRLAAAAALISILHGAALAQEASGSPIENPRDPWRPIVIKAGEGFRLAADAPRSFDTLVERQGQFDIEVPKARFPISARKCPQEHVLVRFLAVGKKGGERLDKDLSARWGVLQKLRLMERGDPAVPSTEVNVRIARDYFVDEPVPGEPVLAACTAMVAETK